MGLLNEFGITIIEHRSIQSERPLIGPCIYRGMLSLMKIPDSKGVNYSF